jgi:hypothetical protein
VDGLDTEGWARLARRCDRAVCWGMLTPNFRGTIGGIFANPDRLLALGAALTVVWLVAALISAVLRRKVK